MSTRSGKRIHNPSFEDTIQAEAELVVRSERKTRSKRIVENGDGQEVVLKSKKRQNYVSYPVNDDAVTGTIAVEVETLSKPARVLRRNTLREQNAAAEYVDPTTIVKKQARQKRRTKNVSETATEEIGTLEAPHHETIEIVTITNGKPKSKKNKKKSTKVTEQVVVIVKDNGAKGNKKKNKRKKNSQSNSLVQVEENNGMNNHNNSNMSTDSFHSAAGSPVQVNGGSTSPEDVESGTHLIHDSTYQGKNKRKSSLKNKSNDFNSSKKIAMDVDIALNTTFDKDLSVTSDKENSPRKSSQAKNNTTFDEEKSQDNIEKLNITFDKVSNGKSNKNKLKSIDSTIDNTVSPSPKMSSDLAIKKKSNGILNTTFEKDEILNESDNKKQRKSNVKVQINGLLSTNTLQQFSNIIDRNNKSMSPRKSLRISENAKLNGTFEISPKSDQTKQKSLNTTFDKESKLDTTFDKESKLDSTFDQTDPQKPSEKSSLISSYATASSINVTLDKSDEISRISITDDDSRTENILNATPLLVESSMEDSKILESSLKENKIPELPPATTPLKREGTFTKEETGVAMSPNQTPNKLQTLPAAGCTPYHSNNKGSKKKSVLNLTHSIEKPGRRSSLAEVLPRATRVMFCSPVNNPVAVMQQKSKVIKSNLKGSNKSFVYEDSEPSPARPGRKRSLSHAPAPAAAKRSRLAPAPAPAPATTLRARSASAAGTATAKLSPPASPAPPPPRSEAKPTRLPNFAALHARRFERMESLEEGQQRRARRALLLLRPAGGLDALARGSPRGTPVKPATPAKPPAKLPTLETLQRGYTRFGFKMDCPVNPFSVPRKPLDKPKEIKPKAVEKKAQPSLVGATSLRRAAAKKAIMREKCFTGAGKRDEDRKESRTIIKGVRTNRRFELQMKSRNING